MENQKNSVWRSMHHEPWAMMPERRDAYMELLYQQYQQVTTITEAAAKEIIAARGKLARVEGNVGILPIHGTITHRASAIQELFGRTSAASGLREFNRMVADESLGSIVLDISSPGGSVYGIEEWGDAIFAARGVKPVHAVANALAASAAYWLGSQAETFSVTPSGEVGSIGVWMLHLDWSEMNAQMGVVPTYISAGKYKVEGHPDAPLDDEARDEMQRGVDVYYDTFIKAVARGRDVKATAVRRGFGEGRTVLAKEAVTEGMVDRVATLEQVVGELSGAATKKGRRSADSARRRLALEEA